MLFKAVCLTSVSLEMQSNVIEELQKFHTQLINCDRISYNLASTDSKPNLPEMDCTIIFHSVFPQDWQVWFLQQLSSDPVKTTSRRLAPLNGHGFVVMVCS